MDFQKWRAEYRQALARRRHKQALNRSVSRVTSEAATPVPRLPGLPGGVLTDTDMDFFSENQCSADLWHAEAQRWRQRGRMGRQVPRIVASKSPFEALPMIGGKTMPMSSRPVQEQPPSTADRVEMSELLSLANPCLNENICRENVHKQLQQFEEHKEELARCRRERWNKDGRLHRRRAARLKGRYSTSCSPALQFSPRGLRLGMDQFVPGRKSPAPCQVADVLKSNFIANRENRRKKVLQRIQRTSQAELPTGGGQQEASSGRDATAALSGHPLQHRKSRLKLIIQFKVKERRHHTQKYLRLQAEREKLLKQIPAAERQTILEAYNIFKGTDEALAPQKVLSCLWELGLRGTGSHERYCVEQVVMQQTINFALAPYGGFGATFADGSRRGSVGPSDSGVPAQAPKSPDSDGESGAQEAAEAEVEAEIEATKAVDMEAESPVRRNTTGFSLMSFGSDDSKEADESEESGGSLSEEEQPKFMRTPTGRDRRLSVRRNAVAQMTAHPVNFVDFATGLVPSVRQQLLDARCDAHLQCFMSLLDNTACVTISMAALQEHLRDKNPSPEISKVVIAECEQLLGLNTPPANGKAQQAARGDRDSFVAVEFDVFHQCVFSFEEKVERAMRQMERKIRLQTNLQGNEKMFESMRPELVHIYGVFRVNDHDFSGFVAHSEVRRMLKFLGMEPYKSDVNNIIERFLLRHDNDSNQEISFLEFLQLIKQLRKHRKRERRPALKAALLHNFLDTAEPIDIHNAFPILKEGNFIPLSATEIVRKLVENTETDANGALTFQAFEDLTEKVIEQVYASAHQRDAKTAQGLGFEQKRVSEFNKAFDILDTDDSGFLTIDEVESTMDIIMKKVPSVLEVHQAFKEIMGDIDKEMGFPEFLRFMKALNAEETNLQDPPFRIVDVEPEKLRTVLRLFPLAESYIQAVDDNDLPELTASFLQVHPSANLREDMQNPPVRNMRTLMAFGAKMVQFQAMDPYGGRK
eukprot:TRINITY_DN9200_c0_g1_i1.p1 TRINITY_DN9200_c0_g1~~TRINITY_DN9200_c0_g1_i1.p1  ORF type:complete len:1117 (+),score=193.96 TRINITY_DN9200_c0_g1_i1:401-3352(+)